MTRANVERELGSTRHVSGKPNRWSRFMSGVTQGVRRHSTRGIGIAAAALLRLRRPTEYRPGVTVVTVNWNSLDYLKVMLDAVRSLSPPDVEIMVVDNGSNDGSVEYLMARDDVTVVRLPTNFGHGIAVDLAVPRVDTEYFVLLDVDAFPVSDRWLQEALDPLQSGALISGAHFHRNYIHPCFFVTRTKLLHDMNLTFRPWGRRPSRFSPAPLRMDTGEALSQRVILHCGGGTKLHRFEVTSLRGPGMAGAVFGGLVYHNLGATWGPRKAAAPGDWKEAVEHYLDGSVPTPDPG